jgi:hypothetical protein
MMLVCRYTECKNYKVMDASTYISKKGVAVQSKCDRARNPAGRTSERVMHEVVRPKLKM